MLWNKLFCICAVGLVSCTLSAYAQERIQFSSLPDASPITAPIAAEHGLHDVQPASFTSLMGDKDGGKGTCKCGDCCWDWWMHPNAGITGMAEIVWLRPQHSSPGTVDGNAFDDGSRFTVGYLNGHGREIRIRGFEYSSQMTTSAFFNAYTLDLEYAGRFQLGCNWAGEFSLGARYADFHEQDENNIVDSGGPVVGLHLKSHELAFNTRLYGTGRYSILFGHEKDVSPSRYGSFSVFEIQSGLEWSRQTRFGRVLARGFVEAQNWTGDFDGSDEDLALIGSGFAIGVTR